MKNLSQLNCTTALYSSYRIEIILFWYYVNITWKLIIFGINNGNFLFKTLGIVRKMEKITNVMEYEPLAKEKLPKMVYEYYASGAENEWTLQENRNAFSRILWVICTLCYSNPGMVSVRLKIHSHKTWKHSLQHKNFKGSYCSFLLHCGSKLDSPYQIDSSLEFLLM